jgi:RNA polymerase sigma factor (sigma-70 family)
MAGQRRYYCEDLTVDTFGQYLDEIGKWPLLTAAQEIELGRLIQAGIETSERIGNRKPNRKELKVIRKGQHSLNRMVLCNLRLVVSVAKIYTNSCKLNDIEDLVQYGSIGLKRAAEKFDPKRGYKFSTYASRWILQGIKRGIHNGDLLIRLPEHCHLDWAKVQKENKRLTIALSRTPTSIELMQASGLSEKSFTSIAAAMAPATSLNVQSENGSEMINNLPNPNVDNEIPKDYTFLFAAIKILSDDDRDLINKRFGIGGYHQHNLVELGQQHGVSRQRVHQKICKIQNRIKLLLQEQMQ